MKSKLKNISDIDFEQFVKNSTSYNQLSKKCGFNYSNSKLNRNLYKRIIELKLSTIHFKGKSWASNVKRPECNTTGFNLEDILVNGREFQNQSIKKKLIKEKGWEDKCLWCRIGPNYNGKSLTLQLDHINGNNTDNRIENLRILCPNCHSQTDTWCASKRNKNFEDVITIPSWFFNEKVYNEKICDICKINTVSKRSKNIKGYRCVECYKKSLKK